MSQALRAAILVARKLARMMSALLTESVILQELACITHALLTATSRVWSKLKQITLASLSATSGKR